MENSSLKLVSLNSWGGRAADQLLPFFAEKGKEIDIFCLQEIFDIDQKLVDERHPGLEVRGDLFRRIQDALPHHMGCFARFDDDPVRMSLALFVRHGIPVRTITNFVVYRPEVPQEHGNVVRSARKLQYTRLILNGREITIANFHGLWNNGPKTDTPERLAQARDVRAFLDSVEGPKILCGDFNLLPETESLAIMRGDMRDLVKESGVGSTRTPLYRHYQNPAEPNFADYILTSQDIDIKNFAVLPDVVSDHAALCVEFA